MAYLLAAVEIDISILTFANALCSLLNDVDDFCTEYSTHAVNIEQRNPSTMVQTGQIHQIN